MSIIRRSLMLRRRLSFSLSRSWSQSRASSPWITGAVLFTLFMTFMIIVQFSTPNLAGNDGFYHIKMAYLIRTEGLKPEFDWLPQTILNTNEFVDHHFLYHLLLIPFTFGDLILGAKLASFIFPSIAFLTIYWLFHNQKVPYSPLWSIGLLVVSEGFIYRMSMPRTQSLSLAVLALALHWLLTDQHRRLFPLAFIYVWLYDAFPLILILTGLYTVSQWLVYRRAQWQPLVIVSLGIGAGLIINPYFPDNLIFQFRHILPKLTSPAGVKVGNEWYPYDTTQLLENSGLALAAFLSGVFAMGLNDRRMDARTGTGLMLSILFGFMLFQARRFVEYFPPFALIFAAFAWAPHLNRWIEKENHLDNPRETDSSEGLQLSEDRRWGVGILVSVGAVVLLITLWFNLQASIESVQRSKPNERYEEASAWLMDNSPSGSRVFQADWDDFPRLFFYNTHNIYTIGLDPTYMQLYDPDLYNLWTDITKGRVDLPAQEIRTKFGSSYILTDHNHKNFLRVLREDPNIDEVFKDETSVVFRIIPENLESIDWRTK